jgi:hypothetical protein
MSRKPVVIHFLPPRPDAEPPEPGRVAHVTTTKARACDGGPMTGPGIQPEWVSSPCPVPVTCEACRKTPAHVKAFAGTKAEPVEDFAVRVTASGEVVRD